jgi:catechol 2,3-dioxygenase-like lactoylglutathione lyase family enzyme
VELTHVRLLVDDFAACFRFYRDAMGLTAHVGDESDTYAEFRAGDVLLGLFGRTEMAEAVGFDPLAAGDRVSLCFAVENVDEALAELRERGAVVVGEPQDRASWGLRVAHVRDPDGNLLELNHQIPMAE